jgi:hypothetical protein
MSTVRIFGTLADVVGQPLDRARVTVALVASSGLPVDWPETETTVVSPVTQTVESAFSFDLVPQSETSPTDSWYTIKIAVPGVGVTVTRAFTVPDDVSEAWVGELFIDTPESGGGSSGSGGGGPTTLTGLVDVDLTGPSDGQVLTFDSATGQWRNEAQAATGATDLEGLADVDLTSPTDGQPLVYDTADSQWKNLSELQVDAVQFGADTNLYRVAANELKTDDNLTVAGQNVWVAHNGGQLLLGAASDVNLYRSTANVLKTDDLLDASTAGLRTKHEGASTPSGGNSGEVRVGNSKLWAQDAGTWKSLNLDSSLPARAQATKTTASLAANASETGTVTIAKSYRLLKLTTNRPARVRLYTTAAKRDADASRPIGTDPTGDHGLQFEFVSTASLLAAHCAPLVDGTNLEGSPSTAIPIAVQNRDTGAGAVTVTLDYLPQE